MPRYEYAEAYLAPAGHSRTWVGFFTTPGGRTSVVADCGWRLGLLNWVGRNGWLVWATYDFPAHSVAPLLNDADGLADLGLGQVSSTSNVTQFFLRRQIT